MTIRNVVILVAVGLFGSCVGCAGGLLMENPAIGGDGWRVVGAQHEVDNDADIQLVYDDVSRCLELEPEPFRAELWSATAILYRLPDGESWGLARGMTMLEARRVYVVRPGVRTFMFTNVTAAEAHRTLRHELIHLRLQAAHPDADDAIRKCARLDWRDQ